MGLKKWQTNRQTGPRVIPGQVHGVPVFERSKPYKIKLNKCGFSPSRHNVMVILTCIRVQQHVLISLSYLSFLFQMMHSSNKEQEHSGGTKLYNEWMRQGWVMPALYWGVDMHAMGFSYRLKIGIVVIVIMVLGFFNESQGEFVV